MNITEELAAIIRKLELAQELLDRGDYHEAKTAVYEAQNMAQFIKDNRN